MNLAVLLQEFLRRKLEDPAVYHKIVNRLISQTKKEEESLNFRLEKDQDINIEASNTLHTPQDKANGEDVEQAFEQAEVEDSDLLEFIDHQFEEESESEADEEEIIDFAIVSGIKEMKDVYKESEDKLMKKCELLIQGIQNSLSDNIALRYIAGYAINKFYLKKKCPKIAKFIKNEELTLDSELLVKYKQYYYFKESNFCNPCDDFFEVVSFSFEIYNICFKNILHIRNVNYVIMNFCIKYCNKKYNNYFSDSKNTNCDCLNSNHKKEIMLYIIRILLRRNCSRKKYEIKASTKHLSHLKKYKN